MVWGVPWSSWLLAVGVAVLALAALVGVVVALRSLSFTRRAGAAGLRARQAQLFAEMVARWDDPDMLAVQRSLAGMDPARFFAHYMQLDERNGMKIYRLERMASFFEDLGTLERLEGLDIEWIDQADHAVQGERLLTLVLAQGIDDVRRMAGTAGLDEQSRRFEVAQNVP